MSISAMNTELFIKEIMSRPAIWKSRHPHYKYQGVNKRLWAEIQMKFPDFSVADLKKKWKNLKDTYRKELKKNPLPHEDDPEGLYQSQWVNFQAMAFLRGECMRVPEAHEGTQEEEDNGGQEDHQYSTSDNETLENEAANSAPASPLLVPRPTPSTQPKPSLNKRKRHHDKFHAEHLEIERKKLNILEQEMCKQNDQNKSDNYYFLMSILPEMDKLNPIQKFRLRNKINQALMEEIALKMYEDPLEQGQTDDHHEVEVTETKLEVIHPDDDI